MNRRHYLHSEESAWWFYNRMKQKKQIQQHVVEMINFRFTKCGVIRMAKPCPRCEAFIWSQKTCIRRVWWSNDDTTGFDSYSIQ